MLLVIDNYDSFTFNLVQYLGELALDHPIAQNIRVERNDALTISQVKSINPAAILLSPGPGDPNQSGVCLEILREIASQVPILGVCLGHQAIAQVFGGEIIQAKELMHGKTSKVFHNGEGVFLKMPNPFVATRYHSLIANQKNLPDCLEVTAWLKDGTIMGIRHRNYPCLHGVQFHPESVLTDSGHLLLSNFLASAESIRNHDF
ncbi:MULTISPECIES: anthranilate synthase component II [Prochlorococcus]|uniref:anthranilate synthase component II n=1 Tax=Prochlorococcus TaxID=1218 RepID=UPI000533710A|nr:MULTISPECIES: aminodeoxychorismate/anthranilate synthase component II [Prochlorococcus]KGG13188.1 Anthranilate synthase [Prochlorococcus sp. MIT 0601]